MAVATPVVNAVEVSLPAATPETVAIAGLSAPKLSLLNTPEAASTTKVAPSVTLPVSKTATGTSSTTLIEMVPVVVLPLASVAV